MKSYVVKLRMGHKKRTSLQTTLFIYQEGNVLAIFPQKGLGIILEHFLQYFKLFILYWINFMVYKYQKIVFFVPNRFKSQNRL